jgi:carbohydrate kinase (thermoresistant glucokinase family)
MTPIIVMGVSGSGKSTLAEALAQAKGWAFIEGDRLHPPANIEKMSQGIALTDEDRWPFLANVAQAARDNQGRGVILSCSALKRRYRDALLADAGPLFFVCLTVDRADLMRRMTGRAHFMPASLLESQLADFEPLEPDEPGITLDGAQPINVLCATVLQTFKAQSQR